MYCDVAAAGLIWLAALGGPTPPAAEVFALPMTRAALAANPLAREPLYADIIDRAGRLRARAERLRSARPSDLKAFAAEIDALAALDLKAHLDLAARGTDGDLKCILKGISQDLPRKVALLEAAPDAQGRAAALDDLVYLLRDNIEVLTAPPAPPA